MLTNTISYRPDIDGLRAIAVLSVLFYHADINYFGGGFVGVDVFFVISGFLITRLLINEIECRGRVDLFNFYLKRMRRLYPAFLFTIILVTILAIWLFSPKALEKFGASLIHSVLSISNVYFYTQSGYFDTDSFLKPLLHTWTLSVEEQFYLFWPILLFFLASRKWIILFITLLVGLISFYLAQNLITANTGIVFFLMPFRMFEFLIGALLVRFIQDDKKNFARNDVLLLIGLALILYSVFAFSGKTLFPGVSALVPCIGAALCIYSGDTKIMGKILSNKLIVWIGLISYSLYLVHWPIIVFYKYHTGKNALTGIESAILVTVSLVVATFMYFCVEKPFRKRKVKNEGFLISCVILTLVFSYIGASMWALNGWGWREWASTGSISLQAVKKGKEARFQTLKSICERKGWDSCDDLIAGKVNALIIGDSHAPDALNAFEKLYPDHNFSMSTLGGCPPYEDIEKITLANHPERIKCIALNENRHNLSYLKQFDYIVINVLFGWYTPAHLLKYLEYLKYNKIEKVIVLGEYLQLSRDMDELLGEFGYNVEVIKGWIVKSSVDETALSSSVNKLGYYFLSKKEALCVDTLCELFDDKQIPFTYDKNHLSYEFAVRIAAKHKNEIDRYLGFDRNLKENSEIESKIAATKVSIESWGPQFTNVGIVQNLQPGGNMGIWIKILAAKELGDVKVLFNEKPAIITSVQSTLVTAAIPPEMFDKIGKYRISIKQIATNIVFPVGIFEVLPNNAVKP